MPIVTNSRSGFKQLKYRYWDSDLIGYPMGFEIEGVNSYDTLPTGFQTTTSFRTGGVNDLPSKEEEYEDSSTQSLRDHLRQEYKLRYDTGNEFSTELVDMRTYSHPEVHAYNPGGPGGCKRNYRGPIAPSIAYLGLPELLAGYVPSDNERSLDGAHAFRLCSPTAPEAHLASFLGETRQKMPELIGAAALKARSLGAKVLGSEFLNYEFGIMPTVSDIQEMARAVLTAKKHLDQMRRDSDKNVRRKRVIREHSQYIDHGRKPAELYLGADGGYGFKPWLIAASTGDAHVFDTVKSKVWFSGAYTYHLSEAHSFIGKMNEYEQLANKLLGSRITVETVWELTPWSWLLDWFANFGGFISNVQALSEDSLVLRYGYIMHSIECTRTWSTIATVGYPWKPLAYETYQYSTSKKRMRASPYGFGIQSGPLTSGRLAILAALGITHGPRGSGL